MGQIKCVANFPQQWECQGQPQWSSNALSILVACHKTDSAVISQAKGKGHLTTRQMYIHCYRSCFLDWLDLPSMFTITLSLPLSLPLFPSFLFLSRRKPAWPGPARLLLTATAAAAAAMRYCSHLTVCRWTADPFLFTLATAAPCGPSFFPATRAPLSPMRPRPQLRVSRSSRPKMIRRSWDTRCTF